VTLEVPVELVSVAATAPRAVSVCSVSASCKGEVKVG
jgi:hypothetical protein